MTNEAILIRSRRIEVLKWREPEGCARYGWVHRACDLMATVFGVGDLTPNRYRFEDVGGYPPDWKTIARRVKEEAGWKCIRCGHPNDRKSGHVLTVHHLDGIKGNCRWFNLVALCQRCHLHIQAKVDMDRPWVWEHSDWFKPYVAGFYAWKYLDEDLSREQVEARLVELLTLEREALLG